MKSNVIAETVYYNKNTGEIITEIEKEIKEPKFKFKNKGNRFTKTWQTKDLELSKSSYYKYFHFIERRLEMYTNRIVIHKKKSYENIPVDKKMLCEITGASKRNIDYFINECIKKKYIALMEINKQFFGYIVNPLYMMNGSKLNLFLYNIFKDDKEFVENIPKYDLIKIKEYLSITNFK